MTVAYYDTSALLKYYVSETGSDWVTQQLTQRTVVLTSSLTLVETSCAFARRLREGVLASDECAKLEAAVDYDAEYHYHILEVTRATLQAARKLAKRHPLRAYDAVHLATALLASQSLEAAGKPPVLFVCADDQLLAAAEAEGMAATNPNRLKG